MMGFHGARTLFFVLGSSFLAACSQGGPSHVENTPPTPNKPAVSAEARAPDKPAVAETRTLAIGPGEMHVDGDHVVFKPDSRVQRAEYDVYRCDESALLDKVGTPAPSAPFRVTVEVIATKEERHTPSDPNMPAPMGGFVTRTHECRVVRVER